MKKDLKHRLRGRKDKPNRTGANTTEESDGPSGSLPRPEPHGKGVGHDEGSGTSTGGREAHSMDQYPQPAGGSDDDRQGREADIDGRKVSQEHSRVGTAVGSGPGREIERVYPSPSAPSIPHSEKPDSLWMRLLQLLCLIIPSDDTGTSAVPDPVPGDIRSNENAEPSVAADENKSSWRSTASATAKLLLRGVNDSADAFGPLKSVAGGLCFILDNCEVRPSSHTLSTTLTGVLANEGK